MEAEYQRLLDLYRHHPELYEAEKLQRMYPSLEDSKFIPKLIAKTEFGRYVSSFPKVTKDYNALSSSLCSTTNFRLTPNQNFVSNFLSPYTPYKGLLLFHGVGVGKTSSAISIAEKHYDMTKKRVLVILSGNIKDNFKKQIFDIHKYDMQTGQANLATGSKYPDMIFDKELMNKDMLEAKINRLINERYQFIGYKQLAVLLKKIEDRVHKIERNESRWEARYNEKVKEVFSNRLIIVDEAHNLRMPSESGKKQISAALLSVLQMVDNTKLLLMTATPMFNDAKEIIWLLNLLLTNDKKPNLKMSSIFDKSGNLSETGKKKLQKLAANYISYMRGENPFSFPFRLYPSLSKDPQIIHKFPSRDARKQRISTPIKHLEIVGSVMSDYQRERYNSIKNHSKSVDSDDEEVEADAIKEQEDDENQEEDNDMQNAIQVSNVAYPSLVGQKGFFECFDREDKKGFKYRTKNPNQQIFAYENLDTHAPKIKTILDRIINSKGIVFVYSQYYYSGIYPLCIALEHIGFKKYNAQNVVEGAKITSKIPQGQKAPSYIVLSRDKYMSPNNDAEIAMAKSLENKDGSIIKVVIVSRIGTEGIDFKNIREVHLMEPWYNLNRIEQIIGRAVRTCSHVQLPKEERNVTVYLHANQYDEKNTEESVDLKMYRISEEKQIKIGVIEKAIKEAAMDCSLNSDVLVMSKDKINTQFDIITSQGKLVKNYKVGDEDGSFLCGFQKCEVKCLVPSSPKSSDSSTFDTIFISNEIDLYKRYIASLYRGTNKAYTFDEIYHILLEDYKSIERDILQYALEDMVENKVTFENFRNKSSGYLIFRGYKYIFHDSSDLRASMREREGYKERPSKIDLSILAKHLTQQQPQELPTVQKEDVPSATIFERIGATIEHLLTDVDTSKKYIIDSVVDRLNETDTMALVKTLMSTKLDTLDPLAKSIAASLLSTGAFVTDSETKTIQFFFNRFTGTVYNKKMSQMGPIEIAKSRDAYDALMKKVVTVKELPPSVKGFVESRKGESKFKIKDNPDTAGYVCVQTSSLTYEDLLTRNNMKTDKDKSGRKYAKKTLCDMYELQLREKGAFARPWLIMPSVASSATVKN